MVGGISTGPFYLYADGITASTYDLAVAHPTTSVGGVQPPTTNTTGLTRMKLELLRSVKNGRPDEITRLAHSAVSDFNEGDPVSFYDAELKLRAINVVFAMLTTLMAEAGVLMDANPGTLKTTVSPIGTPVVRRSWS